ASTKLHSKRIELDAKKEITDKVFESLVMKVAKLDDKTKKKIYENMIKKATTEIDAKYAYVNPKDATLLKSITKGIDVKEENIVGGVIFEDKEGNVRVDYTFDSVLEELKDEYLKEVSEILFKK
ncbi:MAG: V-type ATP synthase subunit E family protein, partial [archaeon]